MAGFTNIDLLLPKSSGSEYGYRTYISGEAYPDHMRRLPAKAVADKVPTPESEFAKPYSEGTGYGEMEYFYENVSFPDFDFLEYYSDEELGLIDVWGEGVKNLVILPGSGVYESTVEIIIVSLTAGTIIKYTIDGSSPASNHGELYSGPFNVTTSLTVRAVGYKTDFLDSNIASAAITIVVATPVISPGTGEYEDNVSVTITTSTSSASIRYTTDGSTPTSTHGTVYSGVFSVSNKAATVKVIAYKTDCVDSGIASTLFTIYKWKNVTADINDGFIRNRAVGWSNTRNAGSGTGKSIDLDLYAAVRDIEITNEPTEYEIHRTFLEFDVGNISGIDDTYTITEAHIFIDIVARDGINGVIQKGTQASPIIFGDYDAFTGSYFHRSLPPSVGWWDAELDASGRAYIQGVLDTAPAFFCIRQYNHDYQDQAPTVGRGIRMHSANEPSDKPYLRLKFYG